MAICILVMPNLSGLNFGIANEYNGLCNLRFDDTNPSREETEYVESIQEDVKWLI